MLSGKDVVKYLVDHLLQEHYLSTRENSDVTYKCLQTPATCSYQILGQQERRLCNRHTYFTLPTTSRIHQD